MSPTDAKQQPTPRGDVLRGMIEKLEGAAEGSRELDLAVYDAFGMFDDGPVDLPPVTTSIDAALALIERKLPGERWEMWRSRAGDVGVNLDDRDTAFAASLPLALCIALLQALTPQVEGGGSR